MADSFLKSARLLLLAEIITNMKYVFLVPVLTRYFDTAQFGAYSQIGIMVSTFAPLFLMGTDAAAIRMFSGKKLDLQLGWLYAWIAFLLANFLGLGCLMYFFRENIGALFYGKEGEYGSLVVLAIIMLLASMLLNLFKIWYVIQKKSFVFIYISSIQVLVSLIAILYAIQVKSDIYNLVLFNFVADSIVVVCVVFLFLKEYGLSFPKFTILKKQFFFGLSMLPSGYAILGLNSIDRIFLVHYESLSTIAVYGVAYSLSYSIIPLTFRPFRVMFPSKASAKFNEGKVSEIQYEFNQSAGYAFYFSMPAAFGLAAIGELVLNLFAGPSYTNGGSVLLLVSLGYIGHVMGSYFSTGLSLADKPGLISKINVATFLINIILNFLLIPFFGIVGAALATMMSYFVQFFLFYKLESMSLRLMKINWLFGMKVSFAAIAMFFCVLAWINYGLIKNDYIMIFTSMVLGCIAYGLFSLVLKLTTLREMLFLSKRVFGVI